MMRRHFIRHFHGSIGPFAWDVDLGQIPLPYFRFYSEGDEDVCDEVHLGFGFSSHWGDPLAGVGITMVLPRPLAVVVTRVFGVRSV